MLVYIPYMDPMGMYNNCASHKSYIGILLSTSTNQHQHSLQNTNASSLFDGLASCCSNHTTPGTFFFFNISFVTIYGSIESIQHCFYMIGTLIFQKNLFKKLVNVGRFWYVSKVFFGLQMAPADTFHLMNPAPHNAFGLPGTYPKRCPWTHRIGDFEGYRPSPKLM